MRLEGGLRAQEARRPVGLRIEAAQRAEQRPPESGRQQRAHPLFGQVRAVAAVAAEALVAAVARQRDGDVAARQLAHAVGRDGRAVGVRLVVGARQRVDQVEVVALDAIDEVPRPVAVGDLLREAASRRRPGSANAIEQVLTGSRGLAGHHRHHGARVDAARRGTRRAGPRRSCAAGRSRAAARSVPPARRHRDIAAVAVEAHVPVLAPARAPARRGATVSVCAGGSFRAHA